jgi:hypothetical protein
MANDAGQIITCSVRNMYGQEFRCSKRTNAHIERTISRLARKAKKDKKQYRLVIIQGCFNTTVAASAGTHDKDAVIDVRIEGMDWYAAQRWLRSQGWAAWVRTPAQGFSYHIHMVSLPKYKYEWVASVGEYVNGQIADYYAWRDGLSSHSADNSWHPPNIKATIFNYTLYKTIKALTRQKDRVLGRIKDLRKVFESIRNKLKRLRG